MTGPHNQHLVTVGEPFSFLRRKWYKLWRDTPPGPVLLILGLAVASIMSIPILYVIWRSLLAGHARWLRLLDQRIPQLLWNTLSLAAAVTAATLVLGVSLAWLVIRTDVPGRALWRWLLALPLVIPPYVGAVSYIIVLGRSGWARNAWINSSWLMDRFGPYPVHIHSFWGVSFVLAMFTFPYVYLITSASLRKMNRNFEEAARSLGLNGAGVFWKITLPSLRPAIGAGAILVSLYVLSDFGAITMLRYVTFTAAIYFQRVALDTAGAAILSLVLMALTVAILWLESLTRRRSRYHQTANSYREPSVLPLGRWKPLALVYVVLVFLFSVVLPASVLVFWSHTGIRMGALDGRFWRFAFNSLKVSGIAAMLCMLLAMPVIYLKTRYPSVISTAIEKLCYAGYALPGVIVALGFIFVFNNHLSALYGTFYVVALALVVRFLPQALQAGDAALSLVSPGIDEAARGLGYPPWKVLLTVVLPNVLPGVLAGGSLVFVSSMKELPATLLLRPPGFDTLAVRVYYEASEAIYHLAAPAALLIILVSVIPLRYMLSRY
ncbi:MAG: iron ABC transporter permease [Bacillota bacterium]